MRFDDLAGLNAEWSAQLQLMANPLVLQEYVDTRAILQPELFLQRLLPPVNSTEAEIVNGSVRIIGEPAKLTAVDSPYHKVGGMQTQFNRNSTFKITASRLINEKEQDSMHGAANSAILRGANSGDIYRQYLGRTIESGVMALDLGEEHFRALTLANGKLDVAQGSDERKVVARATFGMDLSASSPQFRDRSKVGNYTKADSKFWEDNDAARMWTRGQPVVITDPETAEAIMANDANHMVMIGREQITRTTYRYTVQRKAIVGGTAAAPEYSNAHGDLDIRYRAEIIAYGLTDESTGDSLWPKGRLTWFTQTNQSTTLIDGIVVKGGLGVTHRGPNTELGHRPGRYVNSYIPEGRPYHFIVDCAEDIVTELQNPRNVFFVTLTGK